MKIASAAARAHRYERTYNVDGLVEDLYNTYQLLVRLDKGPRRLVDWPRLDSVDNATCEKLQDTLAHRWDFVFLDRWQLLAGFCRGNGIPGTPLLAASHVMHAGDHGLVE